VPAVIILHERYGFVPHPRELAERFARLGMAGFAINCFYNAISSRISPPAPSAIT